MAIHPLPQSTVRLLGSSMNITAPYDLVKELLDNALDSRATAVEITVSSNTIDRISVKDNGSGIDIDDFSALGRRAHTSKLREYSELIKLGGTTLGFRGEALASANSIANISIITKRPGDPIAWRIELVPGTGGVQDKRPVSSTIGTTVAVTRLFENLPPRRQYALKQAKNCIAQIQQLLRKYVFARPNIKMSLKIIGDSKPLWTYSPKPPDLKREAILQILGANGMVNCIEVYEEVDINRESTSQMEAEEAARWVFSGYIQKPYIIPKDFKVQGAHLSIDNRPMSAAWHVAKKMASILKSHISRSTAPKSAERHGGVFLQINIRCPPCSYDPNITMKKDELLIFEEKGLLDGFELVCKRAYEKHSRALAAIHPPATLSTQPHDAPECKWQLITELDDENLSCTSTDKFSGKHDNLDDTQVLKNTTRAARPKIQATMKTNFTVNMGRKEDSDSDEENMDMAIEVEISPGPSSVRDSQTNNQEQHPCQKKNIRHYFQSLPKNDFKIANDGTATVGTLVASPVGPQLDESSPSNRTALQPLNDIALNRIREEAESTPEPPGSDSIVSRHITNESRRDIVPSLRRVANTTLDLGTQGPERTTPSLYLAGPSSQETQDDEVISPSDSISFRMLTPPPSDPRYRHEQVNTQTGPRPQLGNSFVPVTNVAQQSHNEILRDVSLQNGPKKVPSGTNHISYGSAASAAGVFGPSQVYSRRAAGPGLTKEDPSLVILSQQCKNRDGIPRNSIQSFLSALSHSQVPKFTAPYTKRPAPSLFNPQGLPNQPVHTPTFPDNNDGHKGRQESEGSIKIMTERETRSVNRPSQSNNTLAWTTEDSGEYPIRAQRFHTHHRQVRRMSTDQLPLERIDAGKQTFGLCPLFINRFNKFKIR
ncbi:DNA mismatch repair protein, putative [Metarhizium acridum CQMa 102]|uniref:DNA mismatch repair protein, putative n=1 Tax=Metarhizium acridum (strain CQMa 102) TaxID=655827 RepID=E9E2W2_METAQ|nr:DNA mismatch repair protein, putative [Metarhizium acridum CQMa 102]EFY89778.1 DNA mismatch repair protein, putative [Metarhizium acridum CQMa 102]